MNRSEARGTSVSAIANDNRRFARKANSAKPVPWWWMRFRLVFAFGISRDNESCLGQDRTDKASGHTWSMRTFWSYFAQVSGGLIAIMLGPLRTVWTPPDRWYQYRTYVEECIKTYQIWLRKCSIPTTCWKVEYLAMTDVASIIAISKWSLNLSFK